MDKALIAFLQVTYGLRDIDDADRITIIAHCISLVVQMFFCQIDPHFSSEAWCFVSSGLSRDLNNLACEVRTQVPETCLPNTIGNLSRLSI